MGNIAILRRVNGVKAEREYTRETKIKKQGPDDGVTQKFRETFTYRSDTA
jgi:hypothetical protein